MLALAISLAEWDCLCPPGAVRFVVLRVKCRFLFRRVDRIAEHGRRDAVKRLRLLLGMLSEDLLEPCSGLSKRVAFIHGIVSQFLDPSKLRSSKLKKGHCFRISSKCAASPIACMNHRIWFFCCDGGKRCIRV